MYKLLFIDEEKDTLDDFADFVEDFSGKVELEAITLFPLASKEEMIQEIIKRAPDALISDFRLNEMKNETVDYNVPYNGVDLVEEFQSIRSHFPCFVLTALDDEAVNQSDDVNIVYVKHIIYNQELGEGKAKAKFLDRVISQIDHYKARILGAQEKLAELIKIRETGEADVEIENEIIKLDDFLESSIDGRFSIPSEFKSLSNTKRLDNILEKVDVLLEKLDTDGK